MPALSRRAASRSSGFETSTFFGLGSDLPSYGALHEIAGGAAGTVDGAAAALFAAGIAARSKGKVLWCLTRPDLFFPAIAQAGLHPDRVIFCEGDKEEDVLASMEEGLSFGGLAAVVGELVRLPMVASRRLQLAAEKTGTMGLVVRRWRRQTEASDFGNPTASTTRWRVSVLPSEELPVAGVGRPRWLAAFVHEQKIPRGCRSCRVLQAVLDQGAARDQ
jgi:protein ImuA